ncbi:MAG: hypothetical protein M1832_005707 [Thelocarpon impressellum]|nr:MAG: hypothetical protein M1832_005707 [Thelocarpon impressellum]
MGPWPNDDFASYTFPLEELFLPDAPDLADIPDAPDATLNRYNAPDASDFQPPLSQQSSPLAFPSAHQEDWESNLSALFDRLSVSDGGSPVRSTQHDDDDDEDHYSDRETAESVSKEQSHERGRVLFQDAIPRDAEPLNLPDAELPPFSQIDLPETDNISLKEDVGPIKFLVPETPLPQTDQKDVGSLNSPGAGLLHISQTHQKDVTSLNLPDAEILPVSQSNPPSSENNSSSEQTLLGHVGFTNIPDAELIPVTHDNSTSIESNIPGQAVQKDVESVHPPDAEVTPVQLSDAPALEGNLFEQNPPRDIAFVNLLDPQLRPVGHHDLPSLEGNVAEQTLPKESESLNLPGPELPPANQDDVPSVESGFAEQNLSTDLGSSNYPDTELPPVSPYAISGLANSFFGPYPGQDDDFSHLLNSEDGPFQTDFFQNLDADTAFEPLPGPNDELNLLLSPDFAFGDGEIPESFRADRSPELPSAQEFDWSALINWDEPIEGTLPTTHPGQQSSELPHLPTPATVNAVPDQRETVGNFDGENSEVQRPPHADVAAAPMATGGEAAQQLGLAQVIALQEQVKLLQMEAAMHKAERESQQHIIKGMREDLDAQVANGGDAPQEQELAQVTALQDQIKLLQMEAAMQKSERESQEDGIKRMREEFAAHLEENTLLRSQNDGLEQQCEALQAQFARQKFTAKAVINDLNDQVKKAEAASRDVVDPTELEVTHKFLEADHEELQKTLKAEKAKTAFVQEQLVRMKKKVEAATPTAESFPQSSTSEGAATAAAELEAARAHIADLEGKIQVFTMEAAMHEAEKHGQDEIVARVRTEALRMEQEARQVVQHHVERTSAREAELATLQQNADTIQELLVEKDARIIGLETELSMEEVNVQAAQTAISQLQQEIEMLRAGSQTLQHKISDSEAQLGQMHEAQLRIQQLEAEEVNARGAARAKTERAQAEIKRLHHTISMRDGELQKLSAAMVEIQRLETEVEARDAARVALEQTREEIKSLHHGISQRDNKLQGLQQSKDDLGARLDQAATEIKSLRHTISARDQQLGQMHEARPCIERLDSEVRARSAEREQLAQTKKEVDALARELRARHTDLEQTKNEVVQMRQVLRSRDAQLANVESEVMQLRHSITERDAQLSQVLEEAIELRADRERREEEQLAKMEEESEEVDALRTEVRDRASELRQVQAELDHLRQAPHDESPKHDLERMREEAEAQNDRLASMEGDMLRAIAEKEATSASFKSLQAEKRRVEGRGEEAERNLERVEGELVSLQSRQEAVAERASLLATVNEDLRRQMDLARQGGEEAQREAEASEETAGRLREVVRALRVEVAEKEEEIGRRSGAEAGETQLQATIAEQGDALAQLNEQVSLLEAELSTLHAANAADEAGSEGAETLMPLSDELGALVANDEREEEEATVAPPTLVESSTQTAASHGGWEWLFWALLVLLLAVGVTAARELAETPPAWLVQVAWVVERWAAVDRGLLG